MLQIDFINIGYGDAVLVRTKTFSMLVDTGGPDPDDHGTGRIDAASFLKSQGIEHLDLLVLTHPHSDHVGGAPELIDEIPVDELWTNYSPPAGTSGRQVYIDPAWEDPTASLFKSLNDVSLVVNSLVKKSCVIKVCDSDQFVKKIDGLEITAIPAARALTEKQKEVFNTAFEKVDFAAVRDFAGSINAAGICLVLKYKNRTVVLPADLGANLLEQYHFGGCDIFKVPHHGAEDALTPGLLDTAKAKHIVFSVSNDRAKVDGRPFPDIVQMALDSGASIYFTDAVAYRDRPVKIHSSVHFEIDEEIKIIE